MIEGENDRLVDLTVSDLRVVMRGVVRGELSDRPAGIPDAVLTTNELADWMKISPDTLRSWSHRGCPCIRVADKKLRWRRADVLQWLEEKADG